MLMLTLKRVRFTCEPKGEYQDLETEIGVNGNRLPINTPLDR